jgi:hypothetical protein
VQVVLATLQKGARIAHSKHPKKGNAIADRDLIDGYGDSGCCLESHPGDGGEGFRRLIGVGESDTRIGGR